jgi:CO dehydrogenase/acetyl-CoA synthase alpha subunit
MYHIMLHRVQLTTDKLIIRISSFDGSGNSSMSVGINIIDASRDLIISVGHNITYLNSINILSLDEGVRID